jgi:hypothetical protein
MGSPVTHIGTFLTTTNPPNNKIQAADVWRLEREMCYSPIKITKGKCTDRNTFANDKGVECLKAYLEEEWAQDSAAGVKKADF